MHLLLTNDDGYDAPGLSALYRAVAPGNRVSVVAPVGERSVCSHACTLDGPITVRRRQHDVMGAIHSVDGTPVDCVRLAVAELVEEPVDCVVSGINRGANVSVVDVSQSGTIAAAREAAFCGIRSIAVSQMFRDGQAVDWERATRLTATLVPQLLDDTMPPAPIWSVNYPALSRGETPAGVRVVPLARDQIPLTFSGDDRSLEKGRVYHYRGFYEARTAAPGTDVAAVFGNEVAVTPIGFDPTDAATIAAAAVTLHL